MASLTNFTNKLVSVVWSLVGHAKKQSIIDSYKKHASLGTGDASNSESTPRSSFPHLAVYHLHLHHLQDLNVTHSFSIV